ncbi:MAG: diacylglycerol kinase family lipid kinase [Lachnospiraceae bacterium]|nr:diacylglycerol kinase family lipid kinase [Lachnospiraceae bacterium]
MYHFIVNPASRSGKGEKLWKETIKPILEQKKVQYEVHFSKKPGDLIELAKEYGKNKAHLVVVGGDGTVNEVLQGISNLDDVYFSYIPTGSSNDLARDLEYPKDKEQVLAGILNQPMDFLMDVGQLTTSKGDRAFAVSCGIGFDAAVCYGTLHSKVKSTFNKLGLGKLTYLGEALKNLLFSRRAVCDIELDNGRFIRTKRTLFVAVMNHRYEGGGFKFCPAADAQDGILDVFVASGLPSLLILFALPTAFYGKHLIFPGMNAYQTTSVRVKSSRPMWVHTDGEVLSQEKEIKVNLKDQKLHFMY